MKQTGTDMTYRVANASRRLAASALLAAGMMLAGMTTPTQAAEVTVSGTVTTTTNGGFVIHKFTGNGTMTVSGGDLTADWLVVAGGGGGGFGDSGQGAGGGGGAGEVYYRTNYTIPAAAYTVTVGAGGGGGIGSPYHALGYSGNDTVFSNVTAAVITAKGGGGGGESDNSTGNAPLSGGSGGGAGGRNWNTNAASTATAPYGLGNAGGKGEVVARGGGGGGAGGAGVAGASGATGGLGFTTNISGSSVTYGGGGGGGGTDASNGGAGGSGVGVGGYGADTDTAATSGGVNTGSGGGGGAKSGTATYRNAASGGSGIVIVRYVYTAPSPSVTLTAPTNNRAFAWNSAITATATVANATSPSVTFWTNSASGDYGEVASSGSGPYTHTFGAGSFPAGTNHIYAKLVDGGTYYSAQTNAFVVKAAPSVYVTVPTNNQPYAAIEAALGIGVTAVVSNGIGPFTVQFYTNAVGQSSAPAGAAIGSPYTKTLGALGANANYEIYAVVTDTGNGNETATSATNVFQVLSPDLAVLVTGPTEFPYNGAIACTATVSEATGSTNVQFYTNSVATGNEVGAPGSTNPYGISFSPLAPGSYSIYATVSDTIKSATSLVHTVTVLAAPTVTLNTPTPSAQFALNASVTSTVTCGSGKTPYTVTFYTNKNGSAYGPAATVAGAASQTSFTNVLSSLGAGTYGIYAVVSDGYGSQATSGTNIFLVGGTLPTLSHRPPTLVTRGSATFNGFLSTTGNPSTYVYVLYGQNTNAWSYTNAVTAPGGGWTNNSPISQNIGGLTAGLTYYYTIGASNGAPFNATTNAPGTTNFITGEVTVQATDPTAQFGGGASNGEFTIYRPDTCKNEALTVYFTTNGSTASGFTLTPSGSATIGAGSISTVVTLTPGFPGVAGDAILTLTTGTTNAYPVGAMNSATVTVQAAVIPAGIVAVGGTITNYVENGRHFVAHIFTSTAWNVTLTTNFNVMARPAKARVEILVVAGGGGGGISGGGQGGGGGGGAGEVVYKSSYSIAGPTNIPITVGCGGPGGVVGSAQLRGSNGWSSVFGNVTAKGGGGGGEADNSAGNAPFAGGSGGGSARGSAVGASTATPPDGYGNSGGTSAGLLGGGGGGGAGSVGGNYNGSNGGNGGTGYLSSLSGLAGYYGGGGGGGASTNGFNGLGGSGGSSVGGSGGNYNTAGSDAAINTGGGGGGGGDQLTPKKNGGNGAAGIVIVRYDITPPSGTVFLFR